MEANPLNGLNSSDLHLVKNWILCSGNLKNLASLYEVSYPTVKMRINRIIAKIEIGDENDDEFIKEVRRLAIEKNISSEITDDVIFIYKKRNDNK